MELVTVTPDDVAWVARAASGWDCSARWGLRGRTPSPLLLEHLLWDEVLAQRAVKTSDGVPAGLLQLVDVDFYNGVGRLAALLDPTRRAELTGPVAEFLSSSFQNFDLRKICIVAADDMLDVDVYVGARARRVGTFSEHDRRGEATFADIAIYELWRESEPVG